ALIEKYLAGAPGQKVKENLYQLPGIDGPPIGRESHLKPGHNSLGGDLAGGSGQNFRARMADGDQAALARPLGLEIKTGDFLVELAHQIVLQGTFLVGLVK